MYKPVSYLQTDPRWRYHNYSAKGEKTNIGESGCGPTAMAMVLATWADKNVTPLTECDWALAHGYKAPHQGTYYGYFTPAAKRYGLVCEQLNYSSVYNNLAAPVHTTARNALLKGNTLVIACMGPGTWTRSGHFVLVYNIDTANNKVYINDPASTATNRTKGNYRTFCSQVKYYFVIYGPKNNGPSDNDPNKEELDMTIDEMLNKMTNEQAYTLMRKAMLHMATLDEPEWSKNEGHWQRATEAHLVDGTSPERPIKRDEFVAVIGRMGLIK